MIETIAVFFPGFFLLLLRAEERHLARPGDSTKNVYTRAPFPLFSSRISLEDGLSLHSTTPVVFL
jgi:hypothetical protein